MSRPTSIRAAHQNKKKASDKSDLSRIERLRSAYTRLADADTLRKAGKLTKAIRTCEQLIDEYPDYVGALHILGLAHMARSNHWAALSCFMRAAMLNPKDWTILTSLAQVYIELKAPEMAAYMLEQSLALNQDGQSYQTLGQVYEKQKEYEKAAIAFEEALKRDPDQYHTLLAVGRVYVHMGRLNEAADVFSKAHGLKPTDISPVSNLAQLPPSLISIDLVSALKTTAPSKHDDHFQVRQAFSRAVALDKAGNYEEAWANLVKANEGLGQKFHKACQSRQARREVILRHMQDFYKTPTLPGHRTDMPISLFVLGISRSGKTTLEYLLSSIEGVKRGYENPIVERSIQRTSQKSGLPSLSSLVDLPVELDKDLAAHYGEELIERSEGAQVFTNTHPGRITDVGRLATAIPNMRFVFVDRDHDDIAIRVYMKHYHSDSNIYAYSIPTIDAEIRNYKVFADLWCERFPDICTKVEYDDIVSDPRAVVDGIAEKFELVGRSSSLPPIGDDRGCADPYSMFLEKARSEN